MISQDTIEKINKLIEGYLAENFLDLIELSSRREAGVLVLRLLIDRLQGGITLGECVSANRKIMDMLYTSNILSENYTLEVFSPGLDRCLKTEKDFSRCLNKEAVFFLSDLINGKCQWQGTLSKVDKVNVTIQSCGQILEIPLTNINKAQLILENRK